MSSTPALRQIALELASRELPGSDVNIVIARATKYFEFLSTPHPGHALIAEAFAPDATGREFAKLLDDAAVCLNTTGSASQIVACLRAKADQVRTAIAKATES